MPVTEKTQRTVSISLALDAELSRVRNASVLIEQLCWAHLREQDRLSQKIGTIVCPNCGAEASEIVYIKKETGRCLGCGKPILAVAKYERC